MINFSQLFDTYALRARLQPALLTLLPLIVTIAVWSRELYSFATGLFGVAVACGVTLLLAEHARARGRAAEQHFYRKWGGKPTTILFRHSDNALDPTTKDRYVRFLSERIKSWTRPTVEEEARNPTAADQRYESAIRWLLEYTRDKKTYALLFNENIAYGFRRNTYGLKSHGVIVAVLSFLANAAAVYFTTSFTPVHIGSTIFSLLAVFAWLVMVSETWVRDAGNAYALRLLAACEQKDPSPPKRQSKKTNPTGK